MEDNVQEFINNLEGGPSVKWVLHIFVQETMADRFAMFNQKELGHLAHYCAATAQLALRQLKKIGAVEKLDVKLQTNFYSPWVLTEQFRERFGIPSRIKKPGTEVPSY